MIPCNNMQPKGPMHFGCVGRKNMLSYLSLSSATGVGIHESVSYMLNVLFVLFHGNQRVPSLPMPRIPKERRKEGLIRTLFRDNDG